MAKFEVGMHFTPSSLLDRKVDIFTSFRRFISTVGNTILVLVPFFFISQILGILLILLYR